MKRLVLVILTAAVLTAPASADPWTFVSTPDFLNVDVGDLTTYSGPSFNTPSGNSTNASWENAAGTFLDGIAAENPDFVMVAGDLVMARWFQDAWADGVFEQKFASKADRTNNSTATIEQNRVINASDFYYGAWKQRFTSRGLPVYAAVGDHELGDDPSWNDTFGRQTVGVYRDQFASHFVNPFTNTPGATLAPGSSLYSKPASGQHAETAYAIKHRNTLLVTVDVFRQNANGSMSVTVADEQLAWLGQTLDTAADDPAIDHVIVQGHTPVLTPVDSRVSSTLKMSGGADSAFWRTLRDAGVDFYLNGEVHDVTIRQDAAEQSLLQISHGGIFGFQPANDISYLKGVVDGEVITLEMKSLGFSVSGGQFYQPGNPTTQLKDTITLDANGFQSVGSLTIDKSDGFTRFLNATGVFSGVTSPTAPTLGVFRFDATGDGNGFTTDPAASDVAAGAAFSPFAAAGVTPLTSGSGNVGRFAAAGWPGASGSHGPSSYDDGAYVGFTVSAADPGTVLDLALLSFTWNRTLKGPNDGILRVSSDGFVTFVEFDLFADVDDHDIDILTSVDLTGLSPASSFAFRFYFKDSDASGATFMRLDDVVLRGDVALIPEPSALFVLPAGTLLLRRLTRP